MIDKMITSFEKRNKIKLGELEGFCMGAESDGVSLECMLQMASDYFKVDTGIVAEGVQLIEQQKDEPSAEDYFST